MGAVAVGAEDGEKLELPGIWTPAISAGGMIWKPRKLNRAMKPMKESAVVTTELRDDAHDEALEEDRRGDASHCAAAEAGHSRHRRQIDIQTAHATFPCFLFLVRLRRGRPELIE